MDFICAEFVMEKDWKDRKEINGYRILHGNDTDIDLENDIIVEEINGANIINDTLKISIKLNDRLSNVDGFDIGKWTMVFKQGYKIGQILDRIPFGVIDKTITGLGATTLELTTEVRNSIIVVPTKALAYNKSVKINQDKACEYCMYIGSPIGEIAKYVSINDVMCYLSQRKDCVRKFIVVADSLPMLINYLTELEEDVYADYFLMIDEIDTMQGDSAFRPRLEVVMDYYFQFKFYNRAAISATLTEFSNPSLGNEAFLRIEWESQPQREITTLYTTYVDDLTWNEINLLLENSSDEKILVAYNSLDGIFNVLKHLSIGEKDCGILCSQRNSDKVKEYFEDTSCIDESGHLIKRVTFMTCAYFAGIDIMDKCHLIVVTSKLQPFTYLSVNKLTQIAGRCRLGNLSETIIYDIPSEDKKSKFLSHKEFQKSLVERAVNYSNVLNSVVKTINGEPSLKPLEDFLFSFMDFVSKKKPDNSSYPLTIVRQNHKDIFCPAYFNIDALVEVWKLRNHLYHSKSTLVEVLKGQGHIVNELPDALLSKKEHDSSEIALIKELSKKRVRDSFMILKTKLLYWSSSSCLNEDELKEIRRETDKELQNSVVDTFSQFIHYFDAAELLDGLEQCYTHERKLRNFINSLVFLILPYSHPFKASLLASYKVEVSSGKGGAYLSTDERLKTIRSAFKATTAIEIQSEDVVISDMSKSFFGWIRNSKGDKVRCLNPRNFSDPKVMLPMTANILDFIRLPK